ncbi:MAG TPA: tellurite resistance/C4-dicarboxylate transporter family protein [Mucilaginibacter sp.]|nr:tellurite resistance/C4-dicarboxylate transporter family protein [Mucilaginibacter sp.]
MAPSTYVKRQIRELPPVYFALVMATGIVSISCYLLGFQLLSRLFFYLNNFQYGILVVLSVLKLAWFSADVAKDFSDSSKAPGFLTFIAASCVLGIQYAVLSTGYLAAAVLWCTGFAAWLIITYGFLLVLIVKPSKPSLDAGINGGWLVLVVATQSLSVLASKLAGHFFMSAETMVLLSAMAFFFGIFFYLLLIPILFFRMMFDPMKPQSFTPPYWVLMGAAAITSLSGSTLLQTLTAANYPDLIPICKAVTLAAWVIAAWWIPLLIILEIWRHFFRKIPFTYFPVNWDLVFTVGMYTASSFQLARLFGSPLLLILAHIMLYMALPVWLITFISMLFSFAGNVMKAVRHER